MRNYLRSKGRCWPLKLLADFDFPDDYHNLFAASYKELNLVIGRLFFKCGYYFFNGDEAFQNSDEFFFPVIKCKKRQVADRKKTG